MRTVALLVALLALPALDAAAQGIVLETIRFDPLRRRPTAAPRTRRIRLVEHQVRTRVVDQLARTDVVQVFHNPNPWPMEGVYVFPLPRGAAVGEFSMSMGGKQVKGEVLDAQRARALYRSIVHRRRDPGLLEYAGRGLIRARLFPIPARGDTRVTLSFVQVLPTDGGLVEFAYPLRSNRFAPGPVKISGSFEIRSRAGISNVFSPSHKLDLVRKGADRIVASFEEARSPADRDLRVLYSLGRKAFGVALTTYKPAGEDGYFLMLIAPNTTAQKAEVLPKDIVFVLDTSGSMGDRGGQKMAQAKAALRYALGRLDGRDRFNVISFSTEARAFRAQPIAASKENVAAAVEHVQGLAATGGTAIHAALLKALELPRSVGRVPIVIFLTDGQATIGPTQTETILRDVRKANAAQARLFVFGVGDDVNAALLTGLAEANHGASNFVAERENIERKVSAFYDKVAAPVLTDVSVQIADVGQYDLYPRRWGDLFKGQQVVAVGRYKGKGARAITLKGRIGPREVSFVYEARFDGAGGQVFLPRLWAVRKVGFLLVQIRRNGERAELVEEIRKLGLRHGIVTPYTSSLVVDERELRRRNRWRGLPTAGLGGGGRDFEGEAALDLDEAREALRRKEQAGRGAVAGAKLAGGLTQAAREGGHTGIGVKRAGSKTFRLTQGVWIDGALAEFRRRNPNAKTVTVIYLSPRYDELLDDETLARYLSVGASLRVLHRGRIYEVVEQ